MVGRLLAGAVDKPGMVSVKIKMSATVCSHDGCKAKENGCLLDRAGSGSYKAKVGKTRARVNRQLIVVKMTSFRSNGVPAAKKQAM